MRKSLLFFALYSLLCLPVWGDNDVYCISIYNSTQTGITNFTKENDHKHVINNFVIPQVIDAGDQYWVGKNNVWENNKSANAEFKDMPLAEWHENKIGTLSDNAGAVGTLIIYDNSGDPNYFPNFSPAGYGLCYGVNQQGAIWRALPFSLVEGAYIYETGTIEVSEEMQSTMSFWIGFKTATDYVFSSTMSATQRFDARLLNGVTPNTHGRFRININARNDHNNWNVTWVPYHHVVVKSVWENGYSEVIDDQLVRNNDSYALPSAPTHVPHYCTFGEWYLDEGCTQPINAATYTPDGDVTIYAKWVRQPLEMYQFEHSHGKSGRPFIRVNGYDMQDVHTYERTIYMAPNEAQQLYRPDSLTYFRFIRWYDYNKDGTAENLTFNSSTNSLRAYADAFGQFYNRISDQSEAATFTAPEDFTAVNYPNGITIACDQSAYSDAPLRLIATTGESALTGLFWYFYEVTMSGQTPTNVTLLTAADIAAMSNTDEKTIIIASPATNGEGYVLCYNGTSYQGYTNRGPYTTDQLLTLARTAMSYDGGSGRFILTKVADNSYTIRSVKNETYYLGIDGSLHTQGFRNNWTDAQKTLTITEKTGDISSYVNHNYLTTGVDPSRLAITKGDDYLVSNGGWSGFAGSTQWVHAAKAATRHEVYYLVAENKTKLTADDFTNMETGATKTVLWSHPVALPEGYVAVCNGEGSLHGWDYSTNPDESFVNASINWRLGGGKTQSLLFTFTKTTEGDFTVCSTPYQGGATYYLYLDGEGQAMFTADPAQAGHFAIESYGYDMSDQRMPSLSALSRYGVLLRSGELYLSSTANVPNTGRTMPVSTSAISLQSIVTNAGTNAYSSVEPTLSQRLLFHILPADQMATELTDKDAPIAATINEKYLYWAIRKDDGTGTNNFPILRQSELNTLADGDYTIQLVSPLDYNEGGYAFAKDNRQNWGSLSNRNWGSVYHLVTTSTWFTATDWNPTKLILHKQGENYTISYGDYRLCVNNSSLVWSNSQSAQTFHIKAPTEEITLGEHHYDPANADQNYLFCLYYTNGGTTYCLYSGGRYDQTCIKVQRVGSSTKDEWLEERTILAPTGQTIYIGPSLQYTNEGATNLPYYTHTYYINNNGTPLACTASNGTWQWQKDGVDYTPASVMTGRFAQINPEQTAGVHTYTLTFTPTSGNTRYNVFRARVDYRDKAAIGPSSALGYDAVANAQKIGEETFNYNMPGTTAYTAYTEPVPFNESSYGFYYGTNDHYSKGSGEGTTRTFPYWGEYGIINTTNKAAWGIGYDIANHDETNSLTGSDASRGYMLYTDGSEIPGDLFSLQVQDLNLCAGSKMYCSAWVASVTADGSTPVNLDFEVTAISNEGKQSVLTCYTTGDICNSGASHWQHIVFPVTYSAEFGDITNVREFRVRIINKGKNAAGNDFAIDDISFWAKKPAVLPVQASATSCIAGGSTDTIPTYLRIDYEQLVAEEGNVEYYYRWYDAGYQAKEADYYGESSNNNYGVVMLQKVPDEEGGNVFQNYKAFDTYINTKVNGHIHGDTAGVYYVKEQAEDGQSRYFLYVVQPLEITANKTYRVAVASHPDDLASPQTNSCAILESINMIGGARIRVDGNVATDAITPCGNQLYTLDVEMAYLVHNDETGNYDEHSYLCSADWLLGDSTYINLLHEKSDPTYGANYASIEAAILAYRTGDATEAQLLLIRSLVDEGLLIINRPRITTYPNANAAVSTLHYTAYPRALDSENHDVAVCEAPQVVSFRLPDDAQRNGIALGQESELPNIVSANPRNVRMTQGEEEVRFPIRVLGTLRGYVLTHAQLYTTNDEGEKVYGHIVPLRLTDMGGSEIPAVMGSCNVTLYGDVLRALPVGRHTIYLEMTIPEKDEQGRDVSDCEVTYAYFTLVVQPKQLTWQPENTTNGAAAGAWNNDANWSDGVAPIATTQVILPSAALTVPAPDDQTVYNGSTNRTGTQAVAAEQGAQGYITYDINYVPFACRDIYVPAGATVCPQTRIRMSGQAFVDVPFVAGQWQLTSFPIQGVVSGDVYIPEQEYGGQSQPFEVKAMLKPEDRFLHPFYHNLYNASVRNRTGNGAGEETVACSSWLTQTETAGQESGNTSNGNNLSYGYVSGGYNAVALWLDHQADGALAASEGVLRLPKPANAVYSYYDKNTHEWIGYMSDIVERAADHDYGKPVYTESGQAFTLRGNEPSKVFLFGNPTLSYIDMTAFMEVNATPEGSLSGVAYCHHGNSYVSHAHNLAADDSRHFYLPPYGAVLVEKAGEAATELQVVVTDEMLLAAPAAEAPQRVAQQEPNTIRITAEAGGFTTYALMAEGVGDDRYQEGEDADVFLMNASQTPFVIYSVTDDHALAINRHSGLDCLPIALYSHSPSAPAKLSTYLTITGDDDYLAEWDVVLLSSNKQSALKNGLRIKVSLATDGTPNLMLRHSRRPITTGVENQQSGVQKILWHDQIIIVRDSGMYNMQGQVINTVNF